jgi:3-carboxy-cis,cis-muconate cycloisomerase
MTRPTNSSRPSVAQIRDLFARRSLWQSWLDVEAALAESQAELGIIPAEAAHEIRAKARVDCLDEAALAADIARTRAPIVALTRSLAAACSGEAGGYVHWGATTQNIVQTGRTLLMQRAHYALMQGFDDILAKLADLAEREAKTVIVARTNLRHALPITFGFKVAGWIEEWLRHRERFAQAAPRVFSAQWGGAVGAMHAIGPLGPELNRNLAARLGLGYFTVPSRAGLDYFAEYILLLGLFSATCSKIARDLYSMMADEIDEVTETLGDDVVGSSTMPHKVNSKIAVHVLSLAARLRTQVPLALEAMQPTFEGDGAHNQMLSAMVDQACPLAYELITMMDELIGSIGLHPTQMHENLTRSGEFLASENAMMALAPLLGRSRAHDVVHHAVHEALHRQLSLTDAIMADPSLPPSVTADLVRTALDPARYTGLSETLALEMARAARAALAQPPK